MPNPPPPAEIKAARDGLGLSQAAFAAEVGCSTGAVAMWELGVRTPTGLYLRELRRVMARAAFRDAPSGAILLHTDDR